MAHQLLESKQLATYITGSSVSLSEVLIARDKRLQLQTELLAEFQHTIISFTLNIVGANKTFPLAQKAHTEGIDLIKLQCQKDNIQILREYTSNSNAGYEHHFIVNRSAITTKKSLVQLEESCSIGRLFDIDVIDTQGHKISRTQLNLPMRTCLICNRPAFECSRSRTHSVDDLLLKICNMIIDYFAIKYATEISKRCSLALLNEVNATPKPGLVDCNNTGSHQDMDYQMFQASTYSLEPFFKELVLCGYHNRNLEPQSLLVFIRSIGLRAEHAMYLATNHINTHKGILFSMGIVCCALGYMHGNNIVYNPKKLMEICRVISQDLEKDFENLTALTAKTNGEKLYVQFHLQGARGEALAGFPAAFDIGLPIFKKLLNMNYSLNDTSILCLVYIMADFNDTNIISRSNFETLQNIKKDMKVLTYNDTILNSNYTKLLYNLDKDFISQNISPGGCADMLALTYFLYLLEIKKDPTS